MEEHLKNHEKLDEEWAALCAYEPEPCSTAIAEAEGNSECNRPGAALPYDHSRVILNDLANINNSDYINASTIVSLYLINNFFAHTLTCMYTSGPAHTTHPYKMPFIIGLFIVKRKIVASLLL